MERAQLERAMYISDEEQELRRQAAAMTPRPQLLRVNFDGIVEELKGRTQLLGWRLEWRHGKWAKVPYQCSVALNPYAEPKDGRASSTDPNTWCDYDTARRAYLSGRLDGIGYATNG